MKNRLKNFPIYFIACIFLVACGVNFYEPITQSQTDQYYLQEVDNAINSGNYTKASELLAKVESKDNETLLTEIYIKLGLVGLSFWDVMLDIIQTSTSKKSSKSGIDKIMDSLSDSIFGEGDEMTLRSKALSESITLLNSSSLANKKSDLLSCFLSGVLAYPSIQEGKTAVTNSINALADVLDNIVGSGANAGECPNLSELDSSLENLNRVKNDFNTILETLNSCEILNFMSSDGSLNSIEEKLKQFTENADLGCDISECSDIVCQALKLGCVESVLNIESAVANDNKVESCELLINCSDIVSCFI